MNARGEYGTPRKTWSGAESPPSLPVAFEGERKKAAAPSPVVWFVAATIGAAAADKKHRAIGFVGGGIVGVLVDEVLRRISP
jgi:hypothetical protein